MQQFFTKDSLKLFWKSHKWLSILLVVALASTVYGSVKIAKASGSGLKYVLTEATTGTIVSDVSGTGQVAASNQIDLNNNVSGKVISVDAKEGDVVTAGTLIAEIDPGDAESSLESSKIALEKLQEPADAVTLTQAQNDAADAVTAEATAQTTGLSAARNSLVDFETTTKGLNDMFYSSSGLLSLQTSIDLDTTAQADIHTAGVDFDTANSKYTTTKADVTSVTGTDDSVKVTSSISEAYDTATALAKALAETKSAVDYIRDNPNEVKKVNATDVTAAENNLSSWISSINSDLSSLLNSQNSIQSDATAIQEKQLALQKIEEGPDALDVESDQLNITNQQKTYDKYFIRAPFDGEVAAISVKVGDQTSGSVGTFISTDKIANVSLNEVDAAKVAVGDKVTLTFDAIDGLSIAGTVSQVDLVGTVSQGVVSYNVQIGFDTDDARVKPGMSINADIVTEAKQNVITVPSAAVKSQGTNHYVQMFQTTVPASEVSGYSSKVAPINVPVQVGLSDDTNTEITSGLKAGDQVVLKTTGGTTSTTQTSAAPSLLGGGARAGATTRGLGGGGFGGGAGR